MPNQHTKKKQPSSETCRTGGSPATPKTNLVAKAQELQSIKDKLAVARTEEVRACAAAIKATELVDALTKRHRDLQEELKQEAWLVKPE